MTFLPLPPKYLDYRHVSSPQALGPSYQKQVTVSVPLKVVSDLCHLSPMFFLLPNPYDMRSLLHKMLLNRNVLSDCDPETLTFIPLRLGLEHSNITSFRLSMTQEKCVNSIQFLIAMIAAWSQWWEKPLEKHIQMSSLIIDN